MSTSRGREPVVFRRLNRQEFKRALSMLEDKRRANEANERIMRDVVVHPPVKSPDFERIFDDCPAFDARIATLAIEIARGLEPIEAKKLVPPSVKPRTATSPSTPAV